MAIKPFKIEDLNDDLKPRLNKDIFNLPLNSVNRKLFRKYEFMGIPVPRVNEMLEACVGKPGLQYWAAGLGSTEAYNQAKRYALTCGSFLHEMIENYMKYQTDLVLNIYIPEIKDQVNNAYTNFKNWYNSMISNGYILKPLYTEKEITCPWYGGTIDCVLNITHKTKNISDNIILDYKSSKKIDPDYILQTYAYMWSWNWNKMYIDPSLPEMTGIGILRLDKETFKFDSAFLTKKNNPDEMFRLEQDLASLVNWFYSIGDVKYALKIAKLNEVVK